MLSLDEPWAKVIVSAMGASGAVIAAWLHARRSPPTAPVHVDAGPGLVKVAEQLRTVTDDLSLQRRELERLQGEATNIRDVAVVAKADAARLDRQMRYIGDQLHQIKTILGRGDVLTRFNITAEDIRQLRDMKNDKDANSDPF